MENLPVGAELFRVDGRKDRYDEAKSPFGICESACKYYQD
jgi:hypothetical protein